LGKAHDYNGYIGYVRVEGPDIESGVLDIQSVKQAVEGTERILKYFVVKQSPGVNFKDEVNFSIELRDGCWEVLVPVGVVLGVTAHAYFGEALKTMASNDVGDKTTPEVFKSAFKSAHSVLKVAKHLRTMKKGQTLDAKVVSADRIELKDSRGGVLVVTKAELDEYQQAPKDLFTEVAYPAVNERSVHVGYIEQGKQFDQAISSDERSIFHTDDSEQDELFPELEHGMQVALEGYVRRGNQRTNTIGFEYKGHILTCEPVRSVVPSYIDAHYKKSVMTGVVSRVDDEGEVAARPRILFTDLAVVPVASDPQLDLG
jgi:hypothetical protein